MRSPPRRSSGRSSPHESFEDFYDSDCSNNGLIPPERFREIDFTFALMPFEHQTKIVHATLFGPESVHPNRFAE